MTDRSNLGPGVGIIDKYRDYIPLAKDARAVSLAEGNTPLIPLERIARRLDNKVRLYAKFEGLNPTGSFKDRGMTVAVSHAASEGARAVVCASTGNTSAAAAAYAGRAGMDCFVLIPEGKIALGKLAQAMMHGAKVVQIRGNFDEGLDIVRQLPDHAPVTIVNSINPWRLHGQKTAAFEIIDVLGKAPDYQCMPVGNAGNITAYWKGYREYLPEPMHYALPKMVGYQAAGAAPLVHGHPVDSPETVATAIRIGKPATWDGAVNAAKDSEGWFSPQTDDAILKAQKMLAKCEGIFCEPASAISVAGVIEDVRNGRIAEGSDVVCIVTGHGLKDPDTAIAQSEQPETVDATMDSVSGAILAAMERA